MSGVTALCGDAFVFGTDIILLGVDESSEIDLAGLVGFDHEFGGFVVFLGRLLQEFEAFFCMV